jgi:hypothetical protein
MANQQWAAFMASSPQVSSYISIISSAEGLFVFTSALAHLFIILFAYRKGEKWAWYVSLIITTIGHMDSIVENINIGDIGIVIIDIIILVISYGALALAAKAILKKGSA